ncbi:SKP1-like protein 21 isoform X2 [Apium graveolens]|uniref:SKP1-like protein 21 isoform X2 n=1 Tax=Apium graveolens TaxID=4045 RepID=UPI003D78BC2F
MSGFLVSCSKMGEAPVIEKKQETKNSQRNTFDENLLEMDANLLCELMYVAHCLQMESLIDRTFEAILKKIERNSSFEELWHMFDCPDDVTLTRLSMPRQYEETRSIDDLLVFIEGADGDARNKDSLAKRVRTSKKKKNSKKRDRQKKPIEGPDKISTEDSNVFEASSHGVRSSSISSMIADKLKLSNTRNKSFTFKDDFDNGDSGPSPSKDLDREVEEFSRRLIPQVPVIYFDSSI